MSFDYSKLNKIKKNELYQNRNYYKENQENLQREKSIQNKVDKPYTTQNQTNSSMWDRIKESAGNSLKQTAIGMTGNPIWSLLGNINNNVNKFVTDEQKNKVGYIGKRTGAGVIQSITGIGQAGLTDLANQANKGKDKNITNTIGDVVKSFTNISNPASRINPIQTGINTLKTLTNKDKNILQKGTSLATGGISDTLNQILPGKDIINSTTQVLGKINPNTSNTLLKYTNVISKPSEDINKKLNEEGKKYDTITNMLAGAGQTIGNMAPSIALSTVNPTAGLGLMGLSAKGQATKEALSKGADLETAVKIGDTKGIVEIGTEMISGGINIFGKGAIDDLVEKGIINKVKNKVGKQLVQWGVDNAGEVTEELISDVVGTIIDKGTTDPDAKYTWKDFGETATSTILSTTILNLITGGLAGGNINNVQQNIENNQRNVQENQNNTNTRQITQPQNNLSQKQTSGQIKAIETLKHANQNISENKRLYNKSATTNNIDISNKTVQSIQELTERRGIQAKYDANIFNNSNEEAIWTQKEDGNREIIINPNADSNKTLQNIAVHELFHDFEGTQEKNILTKMALEKMKTQEGYENAMKSLADTYAQKYDRNLVDFNKLIEEEASAKFLGENLGNQEFIDELVAKQNRSTVQKVYDWVVDKVESFKNRITGDTEAEYWRKVKSNFEKAFSKQYQGNKSNVTTKYDAIYNKDGSFDRVKIKDNIFKNTNNKSISRTIYDYLTEHINEYADIIESGQRVYLGKDLPGEYAYSKSAQSLSLPQKMAKGRAITELKEIINNATNREYSNYKKQKHVNDAKYGFYKYDTKFSFEQNGKEQTYTGTILIRNDANGKKYLYDILNIKKIGSNLPPVASNSQKSSAKNGGSNFLPTNSITSNKNDVNTTTKYSMQEFENNSQNTTFDNFVKQNSINKGTGETIQQVKLPPKKDKLPKKVEQSKKIENDITGEQKVAIGEKATEQKIAHILEQPAEKVKKSDRKWATFKANFLDKGIVFSELSRKAKNRELDAKWDATLSSMSRGQNAIGNARYEFDQNTKKQKQISKSLEDIRAEIGEKTNDFTNYMYHQLNIDRMTLESRYGTDNKPVFGSSITAEKSKKIVAEYEKNNPEFKEWAKDVYDYNNANKQELVKNGVISQELANKLNEIYPHYIPIQRVDTTGNAIKVALDTRRTGVNDPIKKAKGGSRDILPLFQTMADRTLQIYKASARNSFGLELKNTLSKINQYQQQDMQTTDIDTIMEEMGNQQSTEELLQKGKNGSNPTFTVFENGEKVTFDISEDMYDALKPISDSSILSKNFKILNKISNFRRGVLTEYNPLFLVTNSIKDAQDVLINSQHAAKTYSKFPEAYAQIIKKGYYYNEYVQNGGEQNTYFTEGDFKSNKKLPISNKIFTMPLNAISNVNNVIEMAPRLAEYIASREQGRSIDVSMLDASRVTTNFKAGGDVTKWANRNGATFLNASVQGAMQTARNIQEANMNGLKGWTVLACKTAIAGLPAIILNNLVWEDDEDYEELQDYVKDNYYCIAKYGYGKFIRIPKGRALATIQKVVSSADKYITDEKEINADNLTKDFWEILSFAVDNLAPNNPIDNNVASPIVQAVTNTSWYGEDIVPSRLQDKPKAEQYDETTDSFSIWLGQKLNISPYKINYVLDQYGGGISDIVLPAMTKQAENNVVEDKFTTDSVMKSKRPGEFFNKVDELTINNNSSKATDEDIVKYKYISSVSSDIGKLYTQKREIQNSDATDKEKKEQLREVQKQINSLAKTSVENVDKFELNENSTTANIGDKQYYKVDGEWKVLDDKEEKELKEKNVSTKVYSDYQTQVKEKTESKQKEKNDENAQLTSKEKMQILLDSKYSDEEKRNLYESEILTETNETYEIYKLIGMNINDYMKYKQQEFKSDKKDDGTLDGKSISGSKKKKLYAYVNNQNLPNTTYKQRLVIVGMEYKLNESERKETYDYIKSLNLTKEENEKIFSKLQGFTVYKNGTVKW